MRNQTKGNITKHESGLTSVGSSKTRALEEPLDEREQMAEEDTESVPETDALSHESTGWHAIDWRKTHRNVKRLQARIVKATQAGKHGKVKALQWLLTHSFSAKAEAVKRVTENQGRHTPGVDGARWNTPAKKMAAVHRTGRRRNYAPQPLRRIYIPKSSDPSKLRPLGIPTLQDRAEQALHLLALDPIAETQQEPNSYGFRRERSPADAIGQVFIVLGKVGSPNYILEGDIKSCFDRISHEWLESHVPMDRTILHKWLKAGYIDQHIFHATTEGTPQGGIISPVLANLALDGMEKMLRQKYPMTSRAQRDAKINFVRFADDFIITGASREILEQAVKPLIEAFLKTRGLELSAQKTIITHVEEGFDFLGQHVRRWGKKLIITPSDKSLGNIKQKVRAVITARPMATAGEIIALLNPIIRGWANYHRHVCSSRAFWQIDNYVFQLLLSWTRRKHRNKNMAWIKQTYFPKVGKQDWLFSGQIANREGLLHTVHLFRATSLPIKRHVKVKNTANPYDPAWESYFEERMYRRTMQTIVGRIDLEMLLQRQHGVCPMCGEPFTQETGWERHHIRWRVFGGTDTLDNLQLLHPNCHRQVHNHAKS